MNKDKERRIREEAFKIETFCILLENISTDSEQKLGNHDILIDHLTDQLKASAASIIKQTLC